MPGESKLCVHAQTSCVVAAVAGLLARQLMCGGVGRSCQAHVVLFVHAAPTVDFTAPSVCVAATRSPFARTRNTMPNGSCFDRIFVHWPVCAAVPPPVVLL